MITHAAYVEQLQMTFACIVTVTVNCTERNAPSKWNIHDKSVYSFFLPFYKNGNGKTEMLETDLTYSDVKSKSTEQTSKASL